MKKNKESIAQFLECIAQDILNLGDTLIEKCHLEGIRLRQAKGLYTGRKVESRTSPEQHIKKDRSQKILKYLSDGNYTFYEIAKILKVSPVTIRKTKNIAKELGVLV